MVKMRKRMIAGLVLGCATLFVAGSALLVNSRPGLYRDNARSILEEQVRASHHLVYYSPMAEKAYSHWRMQRY